MWLDDYRRSLKLPAAEEVFDLIIYRPLAFLFVQLVLPTSLTPNAITITAMLLGVAGAYLFSWHGPAALTVGAVLIGLYNVLDCADGQLARLKRNGTVLGRVLDGVIDYVVNIALYFFIAVGLAHTSPDPVGIWILAGIAGVSTGIQAMLFDYYRNEFLGSVFCRGDATAEEFARFSAEAHKLERRRIWTARRVLIIVYLAYLGLQRQLGSRGVVLRQRVSPVQYYQSNRILIRLWSFIGSTTHVTLLIAAALIGRLDIYLWVVATFGNGWMFLLLILQYRTEQALIARSQS
ncbi:MAG: hypothetical protein COS95_08320 [Ignavibacteriales bacterium CG07_land_8_20_14_0_80_59_12]|nr:MAG: hypothetical protein COS95_08320 [Ignavibacteriales bacterium CG07_land_8_20_14_0_80_59_12]